MSDSLIIYFRWWIRTNQVSGQGVLSLRWKGSCQVLLTTRTALKVEGRAIWIQNLNQLPNNQWQEKEGGGKWCGKDWCKSSSPSSAENSVDPCPTDRREVNDCYVDNPLTFDGGKWWWVKHDERWVETEQRSPKVMKVKYTPEIPPIKPPEQKNYPDCKLASEMSWLFFIY